MSEKTSLDAIGLLSNSEQEENVMSENTSPAHQLPNSLHQQNSHPTFTPNISQVIEKPSVIKFYCCTGVLNKDNNFVPDREKLFLVFPLESRYESAKSIIVAKSEGLFQSVNDFRLTFESPWGRVKITSDEAWDEFLVCKQHQYEKINLQIVKICFHHHNEASSSAPSPTTPKSVNKVKLPSKPSPSSTTKPSIPKLAQVPIRTSTEMSDQIIIVSPAIESAIATAIPKIIKPTTRTPHEENRIPPAEVMVEVGEISKTDVVKRVNDWVGKVYSNDFKILIEDKEDYIFRIVWSEKQWKEGKKTGELKFDWPAHAFATCLCDKVLKTEVGKNTYPSKGLSQHWLKCSFNPNKKESGSKSSTPDQNITQAFAKQQLLNEQNAEKKRTHSTMNLDEEDGEEKPLEMTAKKPKKNNNTETESLEGLKKQ